MSQRLDELAEEMESLQHAMQSGAAGDGYCTGEELQL